ncbi:unnamed protein product [Parnassius apollo]|uniref:(apollo) hypothetical protein n=1 Tax=Parnassius apollo TaxID=110799 RepID=A0A8S3W8B6_PARAO|nr:unnamed protein product [Parnassius apollo]
MEEDIIQEDNVINNILPGISNVEESEICLVEKNTTQREEEMLEDSSSRVSRNKRPREEDEEEVWIAVGRNGKRVGQKVDVYINNSEKLPKQFALAKLLRSNNISSVSRVKYINPYKVFIQFENAGSAEELINCKPLQDLGWRCQKPLEVVISYGVIKNVELDLSEKDMLEGISSNCELIAVKRLKRRNKDGNGWEESESIRLGFKGPSLPTCVYIYGMKINVDPYVFPVTQCSSEAVLQLGNGTSRVMLCCVSDEERDIAREERRVSMERRRALVRATQTQEEREAAREMARLETRNRRAMVRSTEG